MPTCPSCQMSFASPGLLYKHQAKFCVGSPTQYRKPYEDGVESPGRDLDSVNRRRQLQMEAERSGRNLDELRDRDRQLRAQKEAIDQRLYTLSTSPGPTNSNVLQEMRQQERRNRDQLEELKRQLRNIREDSLDQWNRLLQHTSRLNAEVTRNHNLNTANLSSIKPERISGENVQDVVTSPELDREFTNHLQNVRERLSKYNHALLKGPQDLLHDTTQHNVVSSGRWNGPLSVGSDLLPEVIAMRQAYLRQGGSNPNILSQMAEMESEARAMESQRDYGKGQPKREKRNASKLQELNAQVLAFEMENNRLQNELERLHDKNNDRLEALRDRKTREAEDQLKQKEYLTRLSELEQEMEVFKKQAQLERLRREVDGERQRGYPEVTPRPIYTQPPMNADMPMLLGSPAVLTDSDPLMSAPYDQNSGLEIFYDYVQGLDMSTQCVRLVTCLYNSSSQYGEPTVLPTVYTESNSQSYFTQGSNSALVGARQPVPRCPPMRDLSLVIELQTASGAPNNTYNNPARLSTKAWAKLNLFDFHGKVVSGRWKLPLRITPIKPHLSANDFNHVPQFGMSEIYVRVVNARDGDSQAAIKLSPDNLNRYTFPPQPEELTNSAPTSPAESTDTQATVVPMSPVRRSEEVLTLSPSPTPQAQVPKQRPQEFYDFNSQSTTLGFQVDRVKHAEMGLAKVRLTVYSKATGKIVQSSTSPVTCSTTAVKSNFKHRYHVFGQQEATFYDVTMQADMILLARLYLRKEASSQTRLADPTLNHEVIDPSNYDDDTLTAWAVLPLMIGRMSQSQVNVGTHVMPLYEAPVPDPNQIPVDRHSMAKQWTRYNRHSSLRLHVFQGAPRPGSLTPSEASDLDDGLPEFTWIEYEPELPATAPFSATDGFDLYIDGCRFLPDSVTISRVAGRVFSRNYGRVGKDINCHLKLESDIYNPVFEEKIEFREPNLPATSTLLLKIYTMDKFTKSLMIVGYCTLNIFVESGTKKQPDIDNSGLQISLNEGGHQLRLYSEGPDLKEPLTARTLKQSKVRVVPCASLLVRLCKAQVGRNGQLLEKDAIPREDWLRMGVWQPIPYYSDVFYRSLSCKPTPGEKKMFQTLTKRGFVSTREAVKMITEDKVSRNLTTDSLIENHIRTVLTKSMDTDPLPVELTFITEYNPKYGIKVSLDNAMNIPWTNFTHATVCLNPPGAFYMGQPHMAYDKPKFTQNLVLETTNKGPEWKDGFFEFPNRSYHQYMTVIIHLQEISVTSHRDTYKYGLLNQAWAVVQVFEEGYANTSFFQLPLFHGSPKPHHLRELTKEPTKRWMVTNVRNGNLKPVEWGSVFLRVSDGRRDEELPMEISDKQAVAVNTTYLPRSRIELYGQEETGKDILTLIPPGKSPHTFLENLASKFKSLVYKLYEESQPLS